MNLNELKNDYIFCKDKNDFIKEIKKRKWIFEQFVIVGYFEETPLDSLLDEKIKSFYFKYDFRRKIKDFNNFLEENKGIFPGLFLFKSDPNNVISEISNSAERILHKNHKEIIKNVELFLNYLKTFE